MTTIKLDEETAAVLLDLCHNLTHNEREIVFLIRQGVYCLPRLEDAFIEARRDPSAVERPEIPLLVPGSLYKPINPTP
jgi:hypothetical protein